MRARSYFLISLLWFQACAAGAAEIRIVASPSLSATFAELGPLFEAATGHKLTVRYGLVASQKEQIEAGGFDLAVVPAVVLDDAIKRGKVGAATAVDVARVGLGVGMRAGTARPDLASVDAFKRALLRANSVSYVIDEPAGRVITKGFERMGIGEAMKAKTKARDSTKDVWQAVAVGEAEMGFGLASNAVSVRGVELVGLFPAELQSYTILRAGIAAEAREAEAAKALLGYLTAPDAKAVLKAKGLEPAVP